MVELTVLGISLQGEGGAPVLLLHPHGSQRILTLSIGPMEAFAISSILNAPEPERAEATLLKKQEASLSPDGRGGSSVSAQPVFVEQESGVASPVIFPRPQTHDLALQLLHTLGGRLLGVEILRVVDGIFLAEAVLSTGSTITRVDCRPSDGVALALRSGARIRATGAVLAYAEESADVLNALPEHVRLLARSRLMREEARQIFAAQEECDTPIPLAVKAALAVSDKYLGVAGAERRAPARDAGTLPSGGIALEDMEAEAADIRSVAQALKRQAEALASGRRVTVGPQGASIRVSLVQQKSSGEMEVVDTAEITAKPRQAPVIGPTISEMRENMNEDERWSALLKVLTPETKALM